MDIDEKIMEKCFDIAVEEYGRDYYELSDRIQFKIWERANEDVQCSLIDDAMNREEML